jgi:hypothetical protein
MKELRKLIFISPGLIELGDSGHYSTLHKSLERGCLENGLTLAISGDPKKIPAKTIGDEGGFRAALVYEGNLSLLRDIVVSPLNVPTYFNFLRSNDYLLMWLYLKIKGSSGFDETRKVMNALIQRGWVFSADSGNLKTRFMSMGLPVKTAFPFSSAFSGKRNFKQSDWQLGMMAESRLDWYVNFAMARVVSFLWPNLRIKLLNTKNDFYTPGRQKADSMVITSLPATGEEYLDRLSAQFWFLPGKSSHHIFGSSGRSLDIMANSGIVFTRKFNSLGAGSLNEQAACFHTTFPRLRAIFFAIKRLKDSEFIDSSIDKPDRTAQQTIASIAGDLLERRNGPVPTSLGLEGIKREIQEFDCFCAKKGTALLFRILLRLPRRALWKLTNTMFV